MKLLTKTTRKALHQINCHIQRLTSHDSRVLAVRREDNSVWERRAPLAPSHVKKLVESGVSVLVQPSNRRAYPMLEYQKAGAVIEENIARASLIMGVKPPPVDALIPNKTYAFFSHTIKAQEANMPLLDAIIEKNIRLIDYEKMCDSNGVRTVAFGKYAGVTGMINILHGLGLRLLALGHHTPFMYIGPAHNYRNSGMARQAIRDAGYEISMGMMPKSIGPLIFIFTGTGNVSQGAQEVFQELPYEFVETEHLHKVATQGVTNKVYGCIVSPEKNLVRKDGGSFSLEEYFAHPDRYLSMFNVKYAQYASVIINGIYWSPEAPRLISIPDAKALLQPQTAPWLPTSKGCPQLPHRLLAISDISADPGGSIEFVKYCTTIDHPFCLYDADENVNTESFAGNGVLICSIDNMPAQIPRESTDFFGSLLLPYVPDMLESKAEQPFDDYNVSPVVKDAVITSNGSLTPKFQYITDMRNQYRSHHKVSAANMSSDKKVLILGSGYVSAPVVDYLSRDNQTYITLASNVKEETDRLCDCFPNTSPVLLDIEQNQDKLEKLVDEHDLVISLLPYNWHPSVAESCIRNRTNMVTASYLSPQMKELESKAIEAGITVLNEVGVDPGIDHMLAMECFDRAKSAGGVVKSFVSWCGGVPAPEFADNPLRYRFSWSPRGVLLNTISGATYLERGEIKGIPGDGGLLKNTFPIDFLKGFNLEGFPNRNSLPYAESYGIQSAHTILRGTLRYNGFSQAALALVNLGLVDTKEHPSLHPSAPDITWKEYLCEVVNQPFDILTDSLKDDVLEKLGKDHKQFECIEQLGLLDNHLIEKKNTPLDTLSNYLAKKLTYGPGERDLLIMRHNVGIQWQDKTEEVRNIDFIVYGDETYTAMSKTVGFPTAIAARMVLDGEIQQKGMLRPLTSDIYRPILKRLQLEGLVAREHTVKL